MLQKTAKCPVTGLPIVEKPHWTDIRISDNFVVSYRLIGDRILHVIPQGHFARIDLKKARDAQEQVVKEAVAPGIKIVEIADFKNITGSPARSGNMADTRYFEQKSKQYLASIAFNASRKTKLFLLVIASIRKEAYLFEIQDDYEKAVKRAQQIIQQSDDRNYWDSGNFISRPEWIYKSDSMFSEFKVLKDRVLYAVHKGYLRKQDVEPVTQIIFNIFKEGFFQHSAPYLVSDYSAVTGASWYGRVKFLASFRALKSVRGMPRAFIMITGGQIINIAMKLAQKKMGVRMVFVKDLEEAMSEVHRLESLPPQEPSTRSARRRKKKSGNPFEKYEDELMDFIGSLTWDTPGKQTKDIPDNYPFKSIFDAISLIKLDIDEMLLESKKAREEAESANNAKSRFLANISHEIRTPLNGILGMTDLLLKSQVTDDQQDQLLDIKYSGEVLMDIIDEILDFSKIEAGKVDLDFRVFRLRDLVSRVLLMLSIKAHEKGLELTSNVAADIPDTLNADSARIRQVLINLIGNAVKFTNQGAVRLDIRKKGETDRLVILEFSVSDTGVGIEQDKIPLIFEEFSQVENATVGQRSGTGLGLSIVHRLVRLMGGEINVESAVGKGSRFFFEIPLEKAVERPLITPPPAPAAGKEFAGLNVLLVEDNLINRKLVERWLKLKGCGVILATNGKESLQKYRENILDVILMDIQMPEMDGYEAAEKIRELEAVSGKHVPIVALTAHALESYMKRSYSSGMDDFLTKPIDPEEMYRVIEKVTNQQL